MKGLKLSSQGLKLQRGCPRRGLRAWAVASHLHNTKKRKTDQGLNSPSEQIGHGDQMTGVEICKVRKHARFCLISHAKQTCKWIHHALPGKSWHKAPSKGVLIVALQQRLRE